ncbi:nicotinate (nicotinamide) nucleotide adenylyltransferase [Sporomusa aerivorans]|uniref:nicotinate (nicotinamide) nucleotide adenylyltransferase n=1 Tax=Sporomusa aerivorans TaxID=204936 RepID=UPI00352AD60F
MKVGIYGSSFNPITNGHLWTANTVADRQKLAKVIFLPSSSKRMDKSITTQDFHRLEMLKLAIAGNEKFEYSDYEMKANVGTYYTYYTMEYFKKLYPSAEVFFIMGADLLKEIPDWKYSEELIKNNRFIVMERNDINMYRVIAGSVLLRRYEQQFILMGKGIVNEISSSYIREEFEFGGDPRYLLPEAVYQYIRENQVYTI